jgi:hypothetical protein
MVLELVCDFDVFRMARMIAWGDRTQNGTSSTSLMPAFSHFKGFRLKLSRY